MRPYKKAFILSLFFHVLVIGLCVWGYYHWRRTGLMNKHLVQTQLIAPNQLPKKMGLGWLQEQFKTSFVVDKQFQAADGLTGMVVHLPSNPDQQSILYTNKDANYVMMGTIIDKHQGNVSE